MSTALPIHDTGCGWEYAVNATPGQFFSGEESQDPLYKRVGGRGD